MTLDDDHALLQRLLDATLAGEIRWREKKQPDPWYEADIGSTFPASFRFLRYEATNQVGADPMAIQLQMPGRNAVFFAGTTGYLIFLEILAVAFKDWRPTPNATEALRFLEDGLAKLRNKRKKKPD